MLVLTMMVLKLLSMLDLMLGVIDKNNARHVKKEISKELIPVAWHRTRWWDWCISEDEKINRTIFD